MHGGPTEADPELQGNWANIEGMAGVKLAVRRKKVDSAHLGMAEMAEHTCKWP